LDHRVSALRAGPAMTVQQETIQNPLSPARKLA